MRVGRAATAERFSVVGVAEDEFAERGVANPKGRLVPFVDGAKGKALRDFGADGVQPSDEGNPASTPSRRVVVCHG